MVRFFFICFVVLHQFCLAEQVPEKIPHLTNKFMMMSIPKSGTHLISKLIAKFTANPGVSLQCFYGGRSAYFGQSTGVSKDQFLNVFPRNQNEVFFSHFNYSYLLNDLYAQDNSYVRIAQIRDLRDVCVSIVHFITPLIENEVGRKASFEKKLSFVINGMGFLKNSVYNVEKNARAAIEVIKQGDAIVCRFEELCGVNGGGSSVQQQKIILSIANGLGVTLNDQQLTEIQSSLWGGTATFRSGQIGSWKKHFTKKNKSEFKKKLGYLLIQLGYEKNMSW